ncbi:MAG: precorrin-6y C5,15-methyltransferase (decarboxylating) subunit CbiE [Clostridia bacterium]
MKTVYIVGMGMNRQTITAEGMHAIERADALIGAKRMVESFANLGKTLFVSYQPDTVAAWIAQHTGNNYAVLVSGDVGFYSAAGSLKTALSTFDVRLLPGISSVSSFFAKCGLPWQDAALVSLHGTESSIVDVVRRNHVTFALTGGNVQEIGNALKAAGFGALSVRVGEDLGADSERVTQITAAALSEGCYAPLTVLIIENDMFDNSVRTGIADDVFLRGDVPMTKAEVRAVSLSKLALRETDVCYDIGCGTGSVTVELALSAHKGRVYAADTKEEAVALTQENCVRFHVGNVKVFHGSAPEILCDWPAPNAAFIGGSGGNLPEIVRILIRKNPCVRIVVNAIALESATAAISTLSNAGFDPELTQISVARTKKTGGLHLMMAQNPIFIISGGGMDA